MASQFRPGPRFHERMLRGWIIDAFHRLWYHSQNTWLKNTYLGYGVKQLPFDLWLYQELVHALRPRFIVQTGVFNGGSILYFAHLLDLIGAPPDSVVIGIDIELRPSAREVRHPRVTLIEGSSVAPETLAQVEQRIDRRGPCIVSLDSDHSRDHVLAEMEAYGKLVPVGSYMVVEDTNVNGHPVWPSFGPGPFEAVEAYFQRHDEFERDEAFWQRNLISFHQHGWLKRVR